MKFYIDKNQFLEKLSLSTHFTSERILTNQLLQGVLIKGEENAIHFYSTNLNSFFHTQVKTKADKKLKILIEPKKINEFLTLLNPGQIEVEVLEKKITISQQKTKGNFPLVNFTDFPLPPVIKTKQQEIDVDFFKKNLPLVLFAASHDEGRPVLTGVNFLANDNLTIVATDGFRLSLCRLKKQIEFPSLIIPANILEELLRLIQGEKEIKFSYSEEEKSVLFKIGETEIYSRLIEGEFPPFEKVIPEKTVTRIVVDKEELARGIKLIGVFARELANVIVFEANNNGLIIRPRTEEKDNLTTIEAKTEGEAQTVAFNYKFVLDFLNHLEEQKGKNDIMIEILRPDAPVVFRSENRQEYLHIIMPVRIQQ